MKRHRRSKCCHYRGDRRHGSYHSVPAKKHIDCKTTRERSSTLIFFVELYVYETDSLRVQEIFFRGLSLCHSLASENSVALPILGASSVRLSAIVAVCGHIHRTIVLILCTTLSSLRRTHFIPLR